MIIKGKKVMLRMDNKGEKGRFWVGRIKGEKGSFRVKSKWGERKVQDKE